MHKVNDTFIAINKDFGCYRGSEFIPFFGKKWRIKRVDKDCSSDDQYYFLKMTDDSWGHMVTENDLFYHFKYLGNFDISCVRIIRPT